MRKKLYKYKSEEEKDFQLNKLEFEKSLELRNFEIDNFWKRAWFFGALILALATGYYNIYSHDENSKFLIYISFFAFLISFFQSLINRGSKYWQERWEHETKAKEEVLEIKVTNAISSDVISINTEIYESGGNFFTRPVRWSVTKLTFLVSDLVALFSFAVWLKDCGIGYLLSFNLRLHAIIFHAIVIGYIIIFIFLKKNRITDFKLYWNTNKGFRKMKAFKQLFALGMKYGGGGRVYEFYNKYSSFEFVNNGTDSLNKVFILKSFKSLNNTIEWEKDDLVELINDEIKVVRNHKEFTVKIPNKTTAKKLFGDTFPNIKG